jgi:hypothetical protein
MPVMTLPFTLLSPEDFAIITAYSEIPAIPQKAKRRLSSVSPVRIHDDQSEKHPICAEKH